MVSFWTGVRVLKPASEMAWIRLSSRSVYKMVLPLNYLAAFYQRVARVVGFIRYGSFN